MVSQRWPRRDVCGILLFIKSPGLSSNEVAAARQTPLSGPQGRPYRQSGPARHGATADLFRRGHQALRLPAQRRQVLSGDHEARSGDDHRRRRRGGGQGTTGRGRGRGARRRGLPRHAGRADPGAAHALGAQAPGPAALRAGPSRDRDRAPATSDRDPCARPGPLSGRRARDHRALFQGDLSPHPGRGHRRGPRLRGACRGPGTNGGRGLRGARRHRPGRAHRARIHGSPRRSMPGSCRSIASCRGNPPSRCPGMRPITWRGVRRSWWRMRPGRVSSSSTTIGAGSWGSARCRTTAGSRHGVCSGRHERRVLACRSLLGILELSGCAITDFDASIPRHLYQ